MNNQECTSNAMVGALIEDSRAVTVEQLPRISGKKQCQDFLRRFTTSISAHCPAVVLDCSQLSDIDRSCVYVLLCCLEEALKRNGDVKLACLTPGAKGRLHGVGAHRIFEVYERTGDAVNSFREPANELDRYVWSTATVDHA